MCIVCQYLNCTYLAGELMLCPVTQGQISRIQQILVERNMTKFYKLVKTVNVNIADPLGMKPIHYVVRLYPDRLLIDVIRTLKENGADLNAKDKFGDRPM